MSSNKKMWELLTQEVKAGNLKEVKRITEIVTSLSDWRTGFECLYNCINSGQIEIAKFLINNGCPVNTYFKDKMLINAAVVKGDEEIVQMLLQKGVKFAGKDYKGLTPLASLAAYRFSVSDEYTKIFNLIVPKLNINFKHPVNGYTALHYAAEVGNHGIIPLLVANKCFLNARSAKGLTALHLAALKGNFQIVSLLLCYKIKHNILTEKNETALCLAVQSGDIRTIEVLLIRTLQSNRGHLQEPLLVYHAAVTGNIAIIELLLLHKASINDYSPETGKTALHVACEIGNEDIVRLLLKKGANPKAIMNSKAVDEKKGKADEYKKGKAVAKKKKKAAEKNKGKSVGTTPLHIAAKAENEGIINLLLRRGALPGAVDELNRTPLHLAVETESLPIVSTLLKSNYGDNCNHMSLFTEEKVKGFTPLHIAVENGSEDIVKLFLDQEIPVEMPTTTGLKSLHIAVQKKFQRIVTLLLKYSADVNAAGQSEFETPLYLAAEIGDLQIIQALSEASTTRSFNWTDAYFPLYIAAHQGHYEIVKMLLCKGVNPNENFGTYLSPLHAAAHKGHKQVVELLLEYGAEINPTNAGADPISTPLLAALHAEHEEIIILLLNRGAKINVRLGSPPKIIPLAVERLLTYGDYTDSEIQGNKSKIGFTPLHFAVATESMSLVKLLLNLGANVNVISANLITPLQIAVEKNLETIVGFLISAGANVTESSILHTAISQKNEMIFQLLLKAKIDVNARSSEGITALAIAVETEQVRIVRDLLEAGADVSVDLKGIPILNIALSKESIEISEVLLRAGVDVNARLENNLFEGEADPNRESDNYYSGPALNVAIKTKNQSIVEMLLKHGANVNLEFKRYTPLYLAVNADLLNIAKILLEAGADPNDMRSFQPILFVAILKKNTAMVDVLIQHKAALNITAPFFLCSNYVNSMSKGNNELSPLYVAVSKSSLEIVKLLLQKGSVVDIELDAFPLHYSVLNGKMAKVKQLLKYGADINSVCSFNKTPLIHAVQQGSVKMVKLLLLNGAKVELKTEAVNSLLHFIIINSVKVDIVKLLFDCGLNVDYTTREYPSSIYEILKRSTPKLEEYSSNDEMDDEDDDYDFNRPWRRRTRWFYGSDESDLESIHKSSSSESEQSEDEMSDETECEAKDYIDQENILQSSSREREASEEDMRNEIDCKTQDYIDVENILESGSRERETTGEEEEDESADEDDCYNESMTMLKLFLRYGADANAPAEKNENVLNYATRIGNSNAVKLLIQNGADINFLDQEGYTPLKYVAYEIAYNLNDLEKDINLSTFRVEFVKCARLLIKEIARLEAFNLDITQPNQDLVASALMKDFYKRCQEEVKEMKNKKICISLKYLDILSENKSKVATYMRNKKVREALSSCDYVKEFPLYGTDLRARVKQAKERKILIDKSVQPLKDALSFEFPSLIIELILDYLSTRDLRNLCIAYNPVILLKTK